MLSCEEYEPESITNALFDNEGSSQMAPEITVDNILTYDANSNGYIEWGEAVGFDIYIQNLSETEIQDISIFINEITPAYNYYSHESIEAPVYIDFVSPYGSQKSEQYWCFNCGTIDEIYVGNFVFQVTESNTGTAYLELDIHVEYYQNNSFYSSDVTKSISIY